MFVVLDISIQTILSYKFIKDSASSSDLHIIKTKLFV